MSTKEYNEYRNNLISKTINELDTLVEKHIKDKNSVSMCLIDTLKEILKWFTQGVTKVLTFNYAAMKFYKNLGFQIESIDTYYSITF